MKLNSNIFNNTLSFLKKRCIEFFGLILISCFIFFSFALIKYQPENSTIIFKSGIEVNNNIFLYYANSIADFFLQSFGLISFLIALSIFSWGISLIIQKKLENIVIKILFTVLYIIFGSLFIYITYNNSFWLIDNGNSGFIGEKSFNLINKFFSINS